jgi:hypothetical protein
VVVADLVGSGDTDSANQAQADDTERQAAGGQEPRDDGTVLPHGAGRAIGTMFAAEHLVSTM